MMATTTKRTLGVWEVRRRFRIPSLGASANAARLEQALRDVPGVRELAMDGRRQRVTVCYEVTKTDYQALERALGAAGFAPSRSFWQRVRSHWYQDLDITGRENAAAPSAPCCNKPPSAGDG